ncbi:MAG: hypothetical protein J6K15_11875 [Lachnospiraceae bacterium]|nr:hypothetical protein [Lachnospiraceae bacterium]
MQMEATKTTKEQMESLNNEIIYTVNRMLYDIAEKINECRILRERVYEYIKKFRSRLTSIPNISPEQMVKREDTFEPITLISYEEFSGLDEKELRNRLDCWAEELENKRMLLNCFYNCVLEAESSYKEILAAWALMESYFESVGLERAYKDGKEKSALEQLEVIYSPGVGGYGGVVEQRFDTLLYYMMEVKYCIDELIYAPLLQKPIGQISAEARFERSELLRILQKLFQKRKEFEKRALLPVKTEEKIAWSHALFVKDALYDEFVWEEE